MKNNIKLLDCTLRDGGRFINCAFSNDVIVDIASELTNAGVDIVEIGFLRNKHKVTYSGNSTFFTDVEQITKYIPKDRKKTSFVAFIDYSMFDFDTLQEHFSDTIDGIRLGFTKKDYQNDPKGIEKACCTIKKLGYKLYFQGVNVLTYTDEELKNVISIANCIEPEVFSIVDTYGAMYSDNVEHIYQVVYDNLNKNIDIGFHSHNNFQLSFSLAQTMIACAEKTNKNIIIDATLNGMGKCSGNLILELIVDFLNKKKGYEYDLDCIFDIVDKYIIPFRKYHEWGYSNASLLAGTYSVHPNNIIYLKEKYNMSAANIKKVLEKIPNDERLGYNYPLIDDICNNLNLVVER